MSIKVVDLNTEETKELPPIEEEEEITKLLNKLMKK
jgi:hypothetical protein